MLELENGAASPVHSVLYVSFCKFVFSVFRTSNALFFVMIINEGLGLYSLKRVMNHEFMNHKSIFIHLLFVRSIGHYFLVWNRKTTTAFILLLVYLF